MDQPRISPPTATKQSSTNKKRSMVSEHESDFEDPLPAKKLAKIFQNSIGFSQTYFSNTKPTQIGRENQPMEPEAPLKQTSPINFSDQLRKAHLLTVEEDKFQKYRAMLPKYLVTKLHPQYQKLIDVTHKVDMMLQQLSFLCFMQSFQNIKNELLCRYNLEIEMGIFYQVNTLIENHYIFFKDPLGKLVVGLSSLYESASLRKYKLKKQLFSFVSKNKSYMQSISDFYAPLAQTKSQITRKQTFFPTKIMKLTQQSPSKLPEEFVNHLQNSIEQKQRVIQKVDVQCFQNLDQVNIRWFIYELQKLYSQYKVTNIYRANIVDWFQKQGLKLQTILITLDKILKANLYLHLKPFPNRPNRHPIIELRQSEAAALVQKLT